MNDLNVTLQLLNNRSQPAGDEVSRGPLGDPRPNLLPTRRWVNETQSAQVPAQHVPRTRAKKNSAGLNANAAVAAIKSQRRPFLTQGQTLCAFLLSCFLSFLLCPNVNSSPLLLIYCFTERAGQFNKNYNLLETKICSSLQSKS